MDNDADFAPGEMDEMMVQDAGELEVQEEVIGDDGDRHDSPDTVSIPVNIAPQKLAEKVPSNSQPVESSSKMEKTEGHTDPVDSSTTMEKIEGLTEPAASPTFIEKSKEPENLKTDNAGDRLNNGTRENADDDDDASTIRVKSRTRAPRRTGKKGSGGIATVSSTAEETSRTRSSTRSSRKKIDPDFCYEDTVAFGGRKRSASTNKNPASFNKSLSVTSSKRVANASSNRQTSKASLDEDLKSVDDAGNDGSKNARNKDPSSSKDDNVSGDEDMPPPLVINVQNSPVKESETKTQTRSRRMKAPSKADISSEQEEESSSQKLYCVCQKPYDNRFMISCDECEEWFHGSCVGVTKKQGEKLAKAKTRWVCPVCASSGADSPPAIAAEDLERMIESENLASEAAAKRKKGETDDEQKPNVNTTKKKKTSKLKVSTAKWKGSPKESVSIRDPDSKYKRFALPKRKVMTPESGAKETSKESPKSKAGKPEDRPPVESDISNLSLTPLGKPARSGTRILRHSRIIPTPTMPPIFKPDIPVPQSPRAERIERSDSISSSDKTEPLRRSDFSLKVDVPAKFEQKAQPKPQPLKLKKDWCMVCKVKVARDATSLYCSSDCILRHGLDAVEILKNADGEPLERIPVVDKITGTELTGDEAPTRICLLAWLESHQSYSVPIPPDLLKAREEEVSKGPRLDVVRASTRAMLRDHLLNRWKDAPDMRKNVSAEILTELVTKIEEGIFKKFKDTNLEYKKKYRAIVLNITDKKNENFFRRLITQEIPPSEVAGLSPEQMASDTLAEWRHKELHKELDMIIQTQTEQQLAPPAAPVKINHRGDEVSEDLVPDEKQIDLAGASGAPDTTSANYDDEIESMGGDSKVVTSPASHQSPSQSVSSPNYSLSSLYKVNSTGNRTQAESAMAIPDTGSPEKPEEDSKVTEHRTHNMFDINCDMCTKSFPIFLSKQGKTGTKAEYALPRRPSEKGTTYLGPTVTSSFKVPAEKPADDEDDASPRSSTSEYSENDDAAGIIWKGQVDTKDLPAAKLVATAVYGRAAEFMAELPRVLDQLGRIQPGQLWPYIEQVKPLKEIAAVVLKSPTLRASNEFNSLHYFLTTRGRVSVLGPLPATFKDFYMIALKENEPLPDSLRFSEGVIFPAEHAKLFLGIIVHHPVTRQAVTVVRSMFDIPAKILVEPKKSFVDASPRTPPPIETNPSAATYEPSPMKKHDPIVSRYLELAPSASATTSSEPTSGETVDTSEPMELDEEVKSSHIEEVKPLEKEEKKPTVSKTKEVSVPDLIKLVQSLPSHQQEVLGLKPKKGDKPSVASLADPRLSRAKSQAVVEPVAASPSTAIPYPAKTGTIEIKPIKTILADVSKPPPVLSDVIKLSSSNVDTFKPFPTLPTDVTRPPPNFVSSFKAETAVPSSTAAVPATTGTEVEESDDSGFGFSKKFIENLSKIEFPAGLKEALKSINAGSEPSPRKAQPMVDVSKPPPGPPHTTTGLGGPHNGPSHPIPAAGPVKMPLLSTPHPNVPPPMAGQFAPGPMRPGMNVPPPNMARPPFPLPNNGQRPMFRPIFPPLGMQHKEPGLSFGERPQPGDFRPTGGTQWNGPPDINRNRSGADHGATFQRNDGRHESPGRDREEFRRGGDRRDRPSERPDRRDDRRRSSPAGRDRRDDRRDDRPRRDGTREDRPDRRDGRPRRDDDRPARRRSRSQSPPSRRRRRTRSSSRERSNKKRGAEGGVDEFGRDLSLRRTSKTRDGSSTKRSSSKDSEKEVPAKEPENEKRSDREKKREASMDKVSDTEEPEKVSERETSAVEADEKTAE